MKIHVNNLFSDMKKYVCSGLHEWYEFPPVDDLVNYGARAKFLFDQHRYIYQHLEIRTLCTDAVSLSMLRLDVAIIAMAINAN